MSLLDEETEVTKAVFAEHNFHASEEWIAASVQMCRGLEQTPITNSVMNQWLHTDLREVNACCLPQRLKYKFVITLPDLYALQMDSVQDVGQPAYKQLQKITNMENDNTDISAKEPTFAVWEPKPSRVLMFSFTDGLQNVSGLEKKPIRSLSTATTPGTKILVRGPVKCRRGVIMLEEKNLTILGGFVQHLVDENSARNVLCRALDQPELAENDGVDEAELEYDEAAVSRENENEVQWSEIDDEEFMAAAENLGDLDDNELNRMEHRNGAKPSETSNGAVRTEHQNQMIPVDEHQNVRDWPEIDEQNYFHGEVDYHDIPTEEEIATAIESNSVEGEGSGHVEGEMVNWTETGHEEGFGPEDDDDFPTSEEIDSAVAHHMMLEQFRDVESETNETKMEVIDLESEQFKNVEVQKDEVSMDVIDLDTIPDDPLSPPKPNKKLKVDFPEIKKPSTPRIALVQPLKQVTIVRNVSPNPFIYLAQLVEEMKKKKKGCWTIKAVVSTVITKLELCKEQKWSLRVKVNDGSAALDMDFSSESLERIIGFSAQEMTRMKALASKEAEMKATVLNCLQKAKKDLIDLNCLMDIQVSPTLPRPIISSIRTLEEEHRRQLYERVNNSLCY